MADFVKQYSFQSCVLLYCAIWCSSKREGLVLNLVGSFCLYCIAAGIGICGNVEYVSV